jgi:hypothetical protein
MKIKQKLPFINFLLLLLFLSGFVLGFYLCMFYITSNIDKFFYFDGNYYKLIKIDINNSTYYQNLSLDLLNITNNITNNFPQIIIKKI